MAIRYTAPIRRGFGTILAYLSEDLEQKPDDPTHPLLRRLKGPSKEAVILAVEFMRSEFEQQKRTDATRRMGGEKEKADPPQDPPSTCP